MHSSRMSTGRSLAGGGGCLLLGVSAPRGCLLPGGCLLLGGVRFQGCLLPGGVCSWGCLLPGQCLLLGGVCFWGVSAFRGICSQEGCLLLGGVCLRGGCLLPACTEADPPVNRITITSKNITLATTSLWPVIRRMKDFKLILILMLLQSHAFPTELSWQVLRDIKLCLRIN